MFTILIPTYKRNQDLEECLQSLRQNSAYNNEIIVLHGGDPETEAICKKYDAVSTFDNARKNGKRVRGLWAILNEGIRLAKYQYVMYLNDDCLVLPEWDKIAESYFSGDEKLGLLVLKTKGISKNPEFRIQESLYGFPCANYAILNKEADTFFDERFDWYYGDADYPLQYIAEGKYGVTCTEENMIIHNHKEDENRLQNDDFFKTKKAEYTFDLKWKRYERYENRLVKKTFVRQKCALISCFFNYHYAVARERFLRKAVVIKRRIIGVKKTN